MYLKPPPITNSIAGFANSAAPLPHGLGDLSSMSHNGYPVDNPSRPGRAFPRHRRDTYSPLIFGGHEKGGFHALQPILYRHSHSKVNHLFQPITIPFLRRQDTEQLSRLLLPPERSSTASIIWDGIPIFIYLPHPSGLPGLLKTHLRHAPAGCN